MPCVTSEEPVDQDYQTLRGTISLDFTSEYEKSVLNNHLVIVFVRYRSLGISLALPRQFWPGFVLYVK